MKEFTVPMALMDYVPVLLFLAAAFLVFLDLKGKMNTASKFMYLPGFLLVSGAGLLKATYKLFYACGAGDFTWMSEQFFPVQAIGFMLAGAGLMWSLKGRKAKGEVAVTRAIVPLFLLIGLVIIGETSMYAALCKYASRLKRPSGIVLFVIAFFLSLCMGYLSSRNMAQASMNWIAQGTNTLGQLAFLGGALILHKAGLADPDK